MTQLIKQRKLVSLVTGCVSSAFGVVNVVTMGIENGITLKDIIVANEAGKNRRCNRDKIYMLLNIEFHKSKYWYLILQSGRMVTFLKINLNKDVGN